MQNNLLSSKLSIIQPLLTRFMKEREETERIAKREGKVPQELCELCNGYGLGRTKTIVSHLKDNERSSIVPFLKWMEENEIISVKGEFSKFEESGSVEVEARKPIGRRKPRFLKKGHYGYYYPLSKVKKRPFYTKLIAKFDGLQSCPHFNPKEPKVVHLFEQKSGLGREYVSHLLFFCCDKCVKQSEKIRCDRGVVKEGFIYRVNCDLNGLIFENILKQENLEYEKGEKEEALLYPSSSVFFLRNHEILVDLGTYPSFDETTVFVLKPKLIVCLGDKSRIIELLSFNTNILVASEEGFYDYDHTRPVEESVDVIVNNIVGRLDNYAEEIRGNEHDRLIKAFEKLGQELGYVPQREYSKHGLRVDCVWYDRQGKIRVAIEVETRGGWKKDIVSTWELEPQLSIITTYQKTDSVPKALIDFALMKSIPHKLLYINMETKNAYLFNKQEILRRYSLKKKGEEERFALKKV